MYKAWETVFCIRQNMLHQNVLQPVGDSANISLAESATTVDKTCGCNAVGSYLEGFSSHPKNNCV